MGSDMTHRRFADGEVRAVEVQRSAWLVELGPIRVARHRTVGRVIAPVRTSASFGLGRVIGASAIALLAIGTPIYLTQASLVGEGGYVVSQRVPDRPRPVVARAIPRPHRQRAAVAVPAPASASDGGNTLDGDQAIAAAWRTGEPQEWASHGAFGIIVPGAIEHEDGMACRSLSRLTRHAGAPDTVARSRQCSAEPPAASAETAP